MKLVTLSESIDAMLRYKVAAGISSNQLRNYKVTFAKVQAYFPDDPALAALTQDDLVGFFAYLRDDYTSDPDGVAPRGKIHLSPKSILNIHTDLSALWSWALDQHIVPANVVRTIDVAKPKEAVVEVFSKSEVEALLSVVMRPRTWKTRQAAVPNPNADRDYCLILLLLDTGLRASEICGIRFRDINLTTNAIRVLGKGQKERLVYYGKRTAKALWAYINPRLAGSTPADHLFVVDLAHDPRPMSRYILARILSRIGERAKIPNVYPHRFRHTFAITYLRNGGDVLTLQSLLGHSDLAMVRRYARIANTDCANAHLKASPVENWKL